MKRSLVLTLVVLSLLLVVGAAAAQDDDSAEGTVYIVQPGDGLIKLARLFFGEDNAYLRIVSATNALAETDSSYRAISDANIILVGQKLFIPGLAALPGGDAPATGAPATAGATTPVTPAPGTGSVLAGTGWVLTSLNGQPALAEATVTLDFMNDGTAAGSAGCNNYTAAYTYDPNGNTISFGPPASTLRACINDAVNQQESAYLQALEDAATYAVTGTTLSLFDAEGVALAAFAPVSKDLAGSSWNVTSYNNGNQAVVSLIEGTTMTASFDEEGTVTGSAGCNNYFGPYSVDGEAISIGPLASTRKLCPGEGVMEQEQAFLAALESAATYQVSGNELRMRTADDAMAVNFTRAE